MVAENARQQARDVGKHPGGCYEFAIPLRQPFTFHLSPFTILVHLHANHRQYAVKVVVVDEVDLEEPLGVLSVGVGHSAR